MKRIKYLALLNTIFGAFSLSETPKAVKSRFVVAREIERELKAAAERRAPHIRAAIKVAKVHCSNRLPHHTRKTVHA